MYKSLKDFNINFSMGQKVHPLGFRVGITKKHQSQWFARFNKYKYAQSVLEDRMLRQTLTNLFPQLLNPVGQNGKKTPAANKNEELSVVPKITQIKIERGLIPYEINIQIHAENCDLIKKSIENLKVNRDLLCHLQKTRRYLQHLRLKFNQLNTVDESFGNNAISPISQEATSVSVGNSGEEKGNFGKFRKPRLTKQQLRRQRLILKRLKKRQSIRRRYKQFVYKGLFLTKKGNKVIQKFSLPRGKETSTLMNFKQSQGKDQTLRRSSRKDSSLLIAGGEQQNQMKSGNTGTNSVKNKGDVLKSRVKKKFVSIFMNRMNHKFLQALKDTFISSFSSIPLSPKNEGEKHKELALSLVYAKKWNFSRVENQLLLKPLSQLKKLTTVLEQKLLKKMEALRKDYIASGLISKTEALNYYQMLNFLKQLKQLISQIQKKQKLQGILNKFKGTLPSPGSLLASPMGETKETSSFLVNQRSRKLQTKANLSGVTLNVLSTKFNNIENECRKIQFIEYLKQVVKKHRRDNIYLYLSTIADARKDLRKLQQFTKRNASFLFGHSISQREDNEVTSNTSQLTFEHVSNLFKQSSSSFSFPKGDQALQQEKTLSEVFLEQIEKQRTMYKDNAQLTPKISIQFYSVNSNALKAKASVIADSVVDALEKRKAFRKVIKDAKEELMRTSGIKGVKIQVAGRLNGAEIARSEWVRAGRVPLQTLRANLDYSYKTANTIYGIIGIKVWIFKGYTKLI